MASCSSLSTIDLSAASFESLLPIRPLEQRFAPAQLSCNFQHTKKAKGLKYRSNLTVRANYSGDSGRPSSAGIFVGGFILGGIIVGALGCMFAPEVSKPSLRYHDTANSPIYEVISKALAGADRKDLMRKLPKFIYDEEKALEKTRKILTEKIAQLNSAIDEVSSQLRADDRTNDAAAASDEVEAAI